MCQQFLTLKTYSADHLIHFTSTNFEFESTSFFDVHGLFIHLMDASSIAQIYRPIYFLCSFLFNSVAVLKCKIFIYLLANLSSGTVISYPAICIKELISPRSYLLKEELSASFNVKVKLKLLVFYFLNILLNYFHFLYSAIYP